MYIYMTLQVLLFKFFLSFRFTYLTTSLSD